MLLSRLWVVCIWSVFGKLRWMSVHVSYTREGFTGRGDDAEPLGLFVVLSAFVFLGVRLCVAGCTPLFAREFEGVVFFLRTNGFHFRFYDGLLRPFFAVRVVRFYQILLRVVGFPLIVRVGVRRFVTLRLSAMVYASAVGAKRFVVIVMG